MSAFVKYKVRWDRFALLVFVVVGLATTLLSCEAVNAMESPSDSGLNSNTAVRAILGEAGNSYEEMRAIAWAIANRGHFVGVYGTKTVSKDFIKNARPLPEYLIQRAMRAWGEAGNDNHGGDHWLSDYDLVHCRAKATAFRFSMTKVGYWGTTHFYRS